MTRFGIIGTGRISDWVMRGAAQDKRFKAVAVCSRSEERAREFIARHSDVFSPDAMVFTSVSAMAACPSVDAVYIGTPNKTHHPFAIACMEAGKHVLCEKPLACDTLQVEEMIEASKFNGVALMEAMISTLNPNFRTAVEMLPEIGRIHQVFASFCQYSTKFDKLKDGIVSNSFDPAMGGGALEDIGIYTTFPLVSIFGDPLRVKAFITTYPSPSGEVDLGGIASLQYPDFTASLSYSKAVDAHQPTEFCGEKGNIIIDSIHNARKVEFIPHGTPSGGRGPVEMARTICEGLGMDDYYYEVREFIDMIEGGATESRINSHSISLANRKLMDQLVQAASPSGSKNL